VEVKMEIFEQTKGIYEAQKRRLEAELKEGGKILHNIRRQDGKN
jgi:hypothetical protein